MGSMALPDRKPTIYSSPFYSEVNDERAPTRVGLEVFGDNPVVDLATIEMQNDPERTRALMAELAQELLAYPNLPVKMTVNLGGDEATQLDLADILSTFRQKISAGYKYHPDQFEAQIHKAQTIVSQFMKGLSAPLEHLCAMNQSGKLTDFSTSLSGDLYHDPQSLRPILNTITAFRLQAAASMMTPPSLKAPADTLE